MDMKFIIENDVLFIKRWGVIYPGDMEKSMENLLKNPEFKNIRKIYSDLTECDITKLTTQDVDDYAKFYYEKCAHVKTAAIVKSDLNYGFRSIWLW